MMSVTRDLQRVLLLLLLLLRAASAAYESSRFARAAPPPALVVHDDFFADHELRTLRRFCAWLTTLQDNLFLSPEELLARSVQAANPIVRVRVQFNSSEPTVVTRGYCEIVVVDIGVALCTDVCQTDNAFVFKFNGFNLGSSPKRLMSSNEYCHVFTH